MKISDCAFCVIPNRSDLILLGGQFWVKYDPYPVSPGHALIIPVRHIESLFNLNRGELLELGVILRTSRHLISARAEVDIDGWNVGVNDGRAAGRTIDHLHIHLIPRYIGDVPDPRGGVRKIMPGPDRWVELQDAEGRERQ